MAVTKLALSVCLLTKNEEKLLATVLERVSFADEIVILDTGSTDRTLEIARQFQAKILQGPLASFAEARNQLLAAARHDWVLFLDGDEVVTPELAQSLTDFISQPGSYVAAQIRFENIFLGRRLRHGDGSGWMVRLGRRTAGRWEGAVHERWQLTGPVKQLSGTLLHYSHADVGEYLQKTDFYTDKDADDYRGGPARWLDRFIYPVAKFIKVYFFQLGLADGWPGLVFAYLNARYSYYKRLKIYQKSHRSS